MEEVSKAWRVVVSSHTFVSIPGAPYEYLVFDVFRPVPREQCRIAFPILLGGGGVGKRLAPFADIGIIPDEIDARPPAREEYDAAADAICMVLQQIFASAA